MPGAPPGGWAAGAWHFRVSEFVGDGATTLTPYMAWYLAHVTAHAYAGAHLPEGGQRNAPGYHELLHVPLRQRRARFPAAQAMYVWI